MGTQLFCTQLASSGGQPEKATISLQRAGRDGQGLHWPHEDAFPKHLRILRVPPPQDTLGTSTVLRETWYREGAGGVSRGRSDGPFLPLVMTFPYDE